MDKERKFLSIVFVIGLIGVSNLAAGILSSLFLSDMNLPERISAIILTIESFDPKLITTSELQTSVSVIQNSVIDELTTLMSFSQTLNALPLYFIINGIWELLSEFNKHKSN